MSSDRSQPIDEITDDEEARIDFWSIQGDFIYRHHIEPRVQLCVPKEETFPIPLRYIDVTGTTHTTLELLQESRIYDHWNIDANRNLSDSWKRFTQFTLLNEKPPKGHMWSGRMSKAAQRKEKQRWAFEKPKLDSARKLRGIYLINRKEFKETIKKRKETVGKSNGSRYAL